LGILGIVWSGFQETLHHRLLPFAQLGHPKFRSMRNSGDLSVSARLVVSGPSGLSAKGIRSIAGAIRPRPLDMRSRRHNGLTGFVSDEPVDARQLA
jgi:hypothetical protein